MRTSAAAAAIAAPLLVLTLGGCSAFPVACPAIGWTNTIEVRVPGSDAAGAPVAAVAFCGGRNCAPPTPAESATPLAPVPAPTTAPVSTAAPGATATPSAPLTAGPEPTAIPWTFDHTTTRDGDTWTVTTSMGTPAHGRVALRGDAGETLVERSVALTWTRHGGSAQCGGPSTARTTVTL